MNCIYTYHELDPTSVGNGINAEKDIYRNMYTHISCVPNHTFVDENYSFENVDRMKDCWRFCKILLLVNSLWQFYCK